LLLLWLLLLLLLLQNRRNSRRRGWRRSGSLIKHLLELGCVRLAVGLLAAW